LSADQGEPEAQYSFGVMLSDTDGTGENKSLRAHYFILSAEQGDAEARFDFGLILNPRDGVQQNESVAALYFKMSADQGMPAAQIDASCFLLRSETLAIDLVECEIFCSLPVARVSLFSARFGRFDFAQTRALFERDSPGFMT
jgi:TPR repeat protein